MISVRVGRYAAIFPPLPLFPLLALIIPPLFWGGDLYGTPSLSALTPSPLPYSLPRWALGCYATSLFRSFPPSPLLTFSCIFIAHIAAICAISHDQSVGTKLSRSHVSKRVSRIIAALSFISWSSRLFSALCLAIWLCRSAICQSIYISAPLVRADLFLSFFFFSFLLSLHFHLPSLSSVSQLSKQSRCI